LLAAGIGKNRQHAEGFHVLRKACLLRGAATVTKAAMEHNKDRKATLSWTASGREKKKCPLPPLDLNCFVVGGRRDGSLSKAE
jgi:hypothetical protein